MNVKALRVRPEMSCRFGVFKYGEGASSFRQISGSNRARRAEGHESLIRANFGCHTCGAVSGRPVGGVCRCRPAEKFTGSQNRM